MHEPSLWKSERLPLQYASTCWDFIIYLKGKSYHLLFSLFFIHGVVYGTSQWGSSQQNTWVKSLHKAEIRVKTVLTLNVKRVCYCLFCFGCRFNILTSIKLKLTDQHNCHVMCLSDFALLLPLLLPMQIVEMFWASYLCLSELKDWQESLYIC